ncbi:MAG: hypothetical protein LBK95_07035 [Bifidobacteriaceae bacterium]|jgi:hypothetical protein|nr:hypothetical protein [Bifidobacteriaceae bacterium]
MSKKSGETVLWRDADLRDMLTADRMQSYLAAVGGDLAKAMALYEWNARVSGAVIQTVALAE